MPVMRLKFTRTIATILKNMFLNAQTYINSSKSPANRVGHTWAETSSYNELRNK